MKDQQRAAMQMALEALKALVQHIEYCGDEDEVGVFVCCGEVSYRPHSAFCKTTKAITALREALAQPQGEPVADSPSWEAFDIAIKAAIEATKEKAEQAVLEIHSKHRHPLLIMCAAAIRSMK